MSKGYQNHPKLLDGQTYTIAFKGIYSCVILLTVTVEPMHVAAEPLKQMTCTSSKIYLHVGALVATEIPRGN